MENEILKKYSELLKEAMKAQNVVQREMYKFIKARLQNYITQPGTPELTESVEIQILNKILKELIDERDNNAKLNKEDRVKELNEQIEVVHKLLPKPATAVAMMKFSDHTARYTEIHIRKSFSLHW